MRGRGCEPDQDLVTFEHIGDVVDGRKRPTLLDVRIEVRCVGGEHHEAATRRYPHALKPDGVAADEMHAQPRRDLLRAVVKRHATGGQARDHRRNIVLLERLAQPRMAHDAPRAVGHLAILDVVGRIGKEVVVAGVIVVHVGDDDVLDPIRLDPDCPQSLGRRIDHLTPALCRGFAAKAGVDHECPAVADNRPHVEIDRHRPVVRIAADEVRARAPVVAAIADGVDLVARRRHRRSPWGRARLLSDWPSPRRPPVARSTSRSR